MGYIGRDNRVVTFTKQSITANGVLTSFTLDYGVGDSSGILVSVGGVVQQPGVAYTASGMTISFSSAPGIGTPVWVVYLGNELFSEKAEIYSNSDSQIATGNGTATPLTLSHSVTNPQSIIVTLNGIAQIPTTDYSVSGTTLTFVAAPNASKEIIVYFLELDAASTDIPDGSVTASTLTASGTLPAWNGSALTNLDSADLSGALPALDGSALLNQPGNITKSGSNPLPNANPVTGLGSFHLNHTTGQMWALTDATANLNTWTNLGTGSGDIENPTAPTNPTNTANFTSITENASYNFTFSGATDVDAGDSVTHYMVDQISDGSTLSVNASSVTAGSAHTFTTGSVGANTNITFRVRARDSYGKYSSGITITTTINNDELPSNPNNGAAFADMNDSTSYNYTFAGATDDNGVTHYMVDQISNAALTVNAAEVTAGSAHTFNAGSVGSDTAVTFRVRAKDTVGQYSSGVTVSMTVLNIVYTTATGGNIDGAIDGDYKYHVFNSSGQNFTVSQVGTDNTVEYLVVAGGGGGGSGWNSGGGGGAGGYRTGNVTVGATSYSITVGGGGARANGSTGATNGTNSVFSSITSLGGGWGGNTSYHGPASHMHGGVGGSGGGGGTYAGQGNGGAGTSGQGNSGGSKNGPGNGAGGGGGASAAGQTAPSNNVGGYGGSGTASSITGSSITRAGGGGAAAYTSPGYAAGGSGGGGNGGSTAGGTPGGNTGSAGTVNSGGGGGGGNYDGGGSPGSAGGSGVVIVRYKFRN